MGISDKKEPLILLVGDIFMLYLSLWVALFLRYGNIPDSHILSTHIVPFSILFAVWIIVFFIAGLYEKHTLLLKSKIPDIVLSAQITNSIIAFLFFYFIPYFVITPKTNLFISLCFSFLFVIVWRNAYIKFFSVERRQKGILVGSGQELRDLEKEIDENNRYNIDLVSTIDLDTVDFSNFHKEIINRIYSAGVSIVIIDIKHEKLKPILPHLYNLIFSKIYFIDMHKVYEEIFDRIPLSLVRYSWFIENLSISPKATYDIIKRVIDIIFSFIFGLISLVFYPFVAIAIKINDGGPLFYVNERLGKNNRIIKIIKFRTMSGMDQGNDALKTENKVTGVGRFLRQSRIDELPQLWNVLRGDLSLIGPRPEIPALARVYEEEVPYYNVRHLIKPGLSGWAQIYQIDPPKFEKQSDATKTKLSYDLYYIKNRSILLDLVITLKTLKALISRVGV
ncbi:hypothetical protein COW81_03195 [Candidatus Campbellbacteria bacterium CG22_combo_CG10-13_8_21_14_all_36_13]|uniref:Bacterial sugar transferase domain-containing protein n=1 Tax=Candidatus Campbellbacteria bacterium CG22_combo_CG10-13_8_21_14_all_36_13 TaxID=1974529 RepID=A0A2H0DYV7_9BACT|nr:MAG: hypothetical protein COW81_03195 [Candidatus Campbellbacteria bacterium CG22_combo_CG10-13_8_21_14_all_36_13]